MITPPSSPKAKFLKLSAIGASAPLLALGWAVAPSQAQISQAVVQEIIDGPQVYIEEIQAKVDDQAEFGQVIVTKKARAGILFNNGASGRLSENASVIVGQCVELERGKLLASGPVNGCMAGVSVAVTGTVYVMERNEGQSGEIKVLEGAVLVSDPENPQQRTRVKAGEKVSVLEGILGSVIPMTPEELVALLSGSLFNGFSIPITPDGALQSMCSNLLPGLSCSTGGVNYSPPIPSLPVPIPFPSFGF
ncbi:sll1892 [Synechocystis sp. PCC 6803]|uniref:Sll1892 protein n=1 Tax=Synechocystis sp. (strain ATCC 27184 / PCC 6803 / Kazusa) TaxID=1111708 RepID=P74107_SYNY3|nr:MULTISPECIES: hypothetical protein [unclassified Synechocystis]AGF51881.1 hypothetical protein MYO_116330 [Synechocystis sp. PCC 6803]ALJ67854.1 hypothetical protein AOY38_08400 [Synechocystis sp. PCC 6803]AVP89683.1 hypothetical protein C7I86_08400 [Synechocystis sp. IPPAS B-1465]MBD2619069.1 hypothetical protein [Synechocystis sp. FACHB-898]MBD2639351.1 hypothetical protein [Synechocystis sp. FACHB-908]